MTPPHEEFRSDGNVLAYFITFRTYGTWLHGDQRGSIDRFHNRYGTPKLPPNRLREQYERGLLKQPSVRLSFKQREAAADGIREVCKKKDCGLWVVNVRTNHAHAVVTASCHSKKVRATIKANATKVMRGARTMVPRRESLGLARQSQKAVDETTTNQHDCLCAL